MWDVKEVWEEKGAKTSKAFYLNYVGCKGIYKYSKKEESQSFTLTMWDVKRRNEIYFRGLDDGFTLTMWDVKSNASKTILCELFGFTLTMWDVKQAS